jgi:3-phosphoshikimate 1-carboxyvinyltransferase
MNSVVVSHPTKVVRGVIHLPASKSISNRLLLMKAVAGFDDLEIHNLSNARDTQILQGILNNLHSNNKIDVHDAGTVMRFLTAYTSCVEGEWILTGSERMQQRPIGALVNVLRNMGADIEYVENENYPPLKIRGKKLKGGKIEIDGSVSSQFISALLMVSPLYAEPLKLQIKNELVSTPYVDMTLKLMREWGVDYTWDKNIISIGNKPYQKPKASVFVESDWSAASYFYSILCLAKEGEIVLPHLFKNSMQGDSVCVSLFEQLGISTEFADNSIVLKKTNLSEDVFTYNFISCPDIAQTLAVCCSAKNIKASLQGLQTLFIKETDRISAIKKELEKFNVEVIATKNSIEIKPEFKTQKQKIDTYEDHRMAMSFAPLALCCDEIEIESPRVVEKSFPHFWDELQRIGFTVDYRSTN